MVNREEEPKKKKKRMPTGMYVGSGLIGFAIFMFLCWVLSFITVNDFLQQGVGDVANFMTILILMPIFGFALPLLLGIRMLRRAGRKVKEEKALELAEGEEAEVR
jgi:hypothetical protein